LNNGIQAIVLKNYSDCILRPVIRTIGTKEVLDLKNESKYLSYCITKLVI